MQGSVEKGPWVGVLCVPYSTIAKRRGSLGLGTIAWFWYYLLIHSEIFSADAIRQTPLLFRDNIRCLNNSFLVR